MVEKVEEGAVPIADAIAVLLSAVSGTVDDEGGSNFTTAVVVIAAIAVAVVAD